MSHIHIVVASAVSDADAFTIEIVEKMKSLGISAIGDTRNELIRNKLVIAESLKAAVFINVGMKAVDNGDLEFLSIGRRSIFIVPFNSLVELTERSKKKNQYISDYQWAFGRSSNCVVETYTPREPDQHGNVFKVIS